MKKSAIFLAMVIILAGASTATFAEDAAALYKAKMCAACHGPDGAGKTPLNTADVQKKSDADLAAVIENGKPPKMPGFKAKGVTDEQVRVLLIENPRTVLSGFAARN